MKKLLTFITIAFALLVLPTSTAPAITVGNPSGTSAGGWFKDSLTVQIDHGGALCIGRGTGTHYTYTSTQAGAHTYAFYEDSADNPYVKVDGGLLQPLHSTCTASPNTATLVKQFSASIDRQAPSVNIVSPKSGATGNGTYVISGTASDPEGTLKTIQAKVNGTLGPTATLSGSTFSVSISLKKGSNTVQMIATDVVGHTATSNTVSITSGVSGSSNSTGSSSNSGSTSSSGGGSAGSSSTGTSGSGSQAIHFDDPGVIAITDPDAGNKASDPAEVQKTAAISGPTGISFFIIIAIVLALLGLCIYIFFRYRPDKPGLRRRIIIIVTLPSLIPLIGLGFLGYQQLSDGVKNQLSEQLQRAAETSAVKLDREFSIRRSVITKTASDVLQIKSQYETQQQQLNIKKRACDQLVRTAIPRGEFSRVTGSKSCLPFLAAFAQLRSSTQVADYLGALKQGANQAKAGLTAQENQRVNESLNSVRTFFPDVLEMVIVDASKEAVVKATLPRIDPKAPTIASAHKELVTHAATNDLALYEAENNLQQLLLTYPIKSAQVSLGGVIIAIDTQNLSFIPAIWQSTPKANGSDKVYFMTSDGQLVTPASDNQQLLDQLKPLATSSQTSVPSLKTDDETYAMRTASVSSVNWVVAVGTPASAVLAPLAGIQRTALLAIVGFILFSVVFGIWFADKIVGEIRELYQGAVTFAKGNLDHRIELKSHDELRVLGDTLNQMATDIKTAQAALIQKDKEFINIATHELKAPMTAIIGYLSMIVEDATIKVDETAREFIGKAYEGTTRLRDLVTDLLDIARLESGHAQFNLEPLDVGAMAKSVIEMQQLPAQQAGVTLVHNVIATPPKVMADKNKLQIIMTNFVSNAIKYNRQGGTVTVSHEMKDGQLVTAVADTGLGIPAEQQGHIFEKFYRVSHQDRASVPGTGLGMYITKQFVENMGGKVWFVSEHGKGTTFYFTLPLEQTPVIGSGRSIDLERTQEKWSSDGLPSANTHQ